MFELFFVFKEQVGSGNLILSYEALGSKNPSIILRDMEIKKKTLVSLGCVKHCEVLPSFWPLFVWV